MSAPQQWGAPPPVPPPRTPTVPKAKASRTSDSSPSTDGPRTPPHAAASAPPLREGLVASNPDAYTRRLPDGVNAARDDPLVLAVNVMLDADNMGDTEAEWEDGLLEFFRLPYRHGLDNVRVKRQLDLAKVGVRDGPRLHDVALYTRVVRWLSEVRSSSSSSSASSSSAPPSPLTAQLQKTAHMLADDDKSGIRLPDLVFVANMREVAGAKYTVSATVEIKSDEEQSIKGLLQGIFYVAQMHELTGAQLGLYLFKTRFVRLFALSAQLVAVEQLRGVNVAPDDASDEQQCRLAADQFLEVLDATSNPQIATKLPWNLRAAPGSGESSIDWSAVSILGAFSLAAWHQLLDLPAAAPFPRFSQSSEGQLAAMGLASTAHTLPLLEDERTLTAAAFARTKLRKWRKGSRRKAGSAGGRSAPASGDSDRGGQGGAGPSTKGKRPAQTSRKTHTTAAKRQRATQAGGRSSAASANDDLLQRHDAGSAADDEDCDEDESCIESDVESGSDGEYEGQLNNVAVDGDAWSIGDEDLDGDESADSDSDSDATLGPTRVYRAFRHSGLEVLMVSSSTMDDLIGGLGATTPATVGAASSPVPKSALALEQLNEESAPLGA